MDTLAPKNLSGSSSGCSTASSTLGDIKLTQKNAGDPKLHNSRSRSFLYCISKHLGRHFLHHHRHRDSAISQEDVRSSSTDSFSLSFEHGSHIECRMATSSSIDLTNTDEYTSRDSSASRYSRGSPPFCPLDTADDYNSCQHIYVDVMYRPNSDLDTNDNDLSSDEDEENRIPEQRKRNSEMLMPISPAASANNTPRSASSASKATGLHLSRISISSSVNRMLQHFSTTSSNATSLRSLSCSSTPLRHTKDTSAKKHKSNVKKSSNTSASTPGSESKKKEKKQQSILRPPMHYVYMKGMSGLYSRVPRYSVCCPYATSQQFA